MLIQSGTVSQQNGASASDELPLSKLRLANGNTLHIFGQVDFATFSLGTFAYQTDSSGVLIAGSEFQLSPSVEFEMSDFPRAVVQFGDGSVGVLSQQQTAEDIEQLTLKRYDLGSGAGYGNLLSTQIIDYSAPSGFSADVVDIDFSGLHQNADGSVNFFVSERYQITEDATGSTSFLQGTKEISTNANGTFLTDLASATTIFDEEWMRWEKISPSTYLAFDEAYFDGQEMLQFKLVDPSVTTSSPDVLSNLFSRGAIPESVLSFVDGMKTNELPDGKYLVTWYLDSFDDDLHGDGIFFAIVDPSKPYGQTTYVDATPVVITDQPNDLAFNYTVEVLEDGSFVIGWTQDLAGVISGQTLVQHFTKDGVPIGSPTELGATGSQEALLTFDELANGNVLVSWAEEISGDTNGLDVNGAVFTTDYTFPTLMVTQTIGGSLSDTYNQAIYAADLIQSTFTPTGFSLESTVDPSFTATVTGTGFKADFTGDAGVFAGVVSSIEIKISGATALTISGYDLPVALLGSAIRQGDDGGNYNLHDAIYRVLPGVYDASSAGAAVTAQVTDLTADYNATGSNFGDTIELGAGDDTIIGLDGNDSMSGNDGDDTIIGNGGRDALFGGAGSDSLYGNGDIDFIAPGAGADIVDGGGSFDRVWYGDSAEGIVVNLTTGVGNGGTAEGDAISNIERVTGSAHDDVITGNAVTNAIKSGAGNDTVYGEGGRDVIELQDGDDEAHGGDANDNILGGRGNDILVGGQGYDKLFGGLDDDILTGGSETDYFVFQTEGAIGFGNDIILDFEDGIDRLDVRQVHFTSNPANVADQLTDFTITNSAIGIKIKLEAGQVIYLDTSGNGMTLADIDANDFIFA